MDHTPTVATTCHAVDAIHRMATPTALVQTGSAEEVEPVALCEANGQISHLQVHWNIHLLYSADYQRINSLRRQRESGKVHQLPCTVARYRIRLLCQLRPLFRQPLLATVRIYCRHLLYVETGRQFRDYSYAGLRHEFQATAAPVSDFCGPHRCTQFLSGRLYHSQGNGGPSRF